MYLLTTYIPSLVKSVVIFAQFLTGLFISFFLDCNSSFLYFGDEFFNRFMHYEYFLPVSGLFFIFLKVYFKEKKF